MLRDQVAIHPHADHIISRFNIQAVPFGTAKSPGFRGIQQVHAARRVLLLLIGDN